MGVSRRSTLAACGFVAATGLLVATAVTSAVAGAAVPVPGEGGCRATARVDAQWGTGATGGQIITVTVTNTSATTATKWTVGWTLGAGQRIVSAWNAAVTTAGTAVTAVNAPHNGVLAPSASTTFGAQLSGLAAAPAPSCGNDTSTPPVTTTPPAGADVTVTQADNLRTVTLRVGQTLAVALGPYFVPPTLSSTGVVVQRDVTGGYPTGQPLLARYLATAAGQTDVSSFTDDPCNHLPMPCPSPSIRWTVHIVVTS